MADTILISIVVRQALLGGEMKREAERVIALPV